MAQINFSTMQIIVENAMRKNNYGGTVNISGQNFNLENSWKNTNPINYQSLRDSIAQSIVDALTATTVSGNISQGTTTAQGQQTVDDSNIVTITTNSDITQSGFAARVGDNVLVTATTDPVFVEWMTTISTVVSSLSGSPIVPPTTVTSTVSNGSTTVKIGN